MYFSLSLVWHCQPSSVANTSIAAACASSCHLHQYLHAVQRPVLYTCGTVSSASTSTPASSEAAKRPRPPSLHAGPRPPPLLPVPLLPSPLGQNSPPKLPDHRQNFHHRPYCHYLHGRCCWCQYCITILLGPHVIRMLAKDCITTTTTKASTTITFCGANMPPSLLPSLFPSLHRRHCHHRRRDHRHRRRRHHRRHRRCRRHCCRRCRHHYQHCRCHHRLCQCLITIVSESSCITACWPLVQVPPMGSVFPFLSTVPGTQ